MDPATRRRNRLQELTGRRRCRHPLRGPHNIHTIQTEKSRPDGSGCAQFRRAAIPQYRHRPPVAGSNRSTHFGPPWYVHTNADSAHSGTGTARSNISIGGGSESSGSQNDDSLIIARIAPDGSLDWFQRVANASPKGIALDRDSSVVFVSADQFENLFL